MLQKAKGDAGFLAEMSEKAGPLNAMAYMILRGVGARKKGGSPKTQGYPTICMKIKGKKNSYRGYPTMFMKTRNLTVLSDDMHENKPLNTRSALAQRVMLSGFVAGGHTQRIPECGLVRHAHTRFAATDSRRRFALIAETTRGQKVADRGYPLFSEEVHPS